MSVHRLDNSRIYYRDLVLLIVSIRFVSCNELLVFISLFRPN